MIEGPFKLLYIGNSNKRFTHDKLYHWFGSWSAGNQLNVTVTNNSNVLVYFNGDYYDYFYDNFMFMNNTEYIKYIRKKKLKAIKTISVL